MSTSLKIESGACTVVLAADTVLQDRYRIVRQLGKGGMGAVYEAFDQRLGITVALKETLSADASVRRQFEHEARLLASLQHPALPRVSDHFTEGNRAFLVMQFITGVDLARIIYQQPGPFPRDQVVAWADQLLDALIYLHSQDRQVIHRDIKPHNLKLTATGQIALLDFGLARAQAAEASTSASAPFFGYTRQYAPLEQIQDLPTGPRSDIYALGATLYHLLTGVKPADALLRAASLANGEPDPLKAANAIHPAVGPEIAAILGKAMAQNAEQRYRSAAEFREALRRVGRRAPSRAHYQPSAAGSVLFSEPVDEIDIFKSLQSSAGRTRGPAFVASVMLIVLTAAGGVFYGYPQWRDWSSPATTPTSGGAAAIPTSRASRQSERTVTNNAAKPTAAKAPDTAVRRNRVSEKTGTANNAVADQLQRLDKVKLAIPSIPRRAAAAPESKVETSRRIKIPNIRLPDADVTEHSPAPAAEPLLLQTYRPASLPVSSWTRRTPNGHTVKFADGSLRVFRPSEIVSEVGSRHKSVGSRQ